MNINELLQRLEELNTTLVFNKSMNDEYLQILNELEQIGVPPLSLTLTNEEDKQVLLSSFSEGFLAQKTKNALSRNGINTVGDLLDINRLDSLNFAGFGAKKWIELYSIKKAIYNLYPHTDITSETIEGNSPITRYTLSELRQISQEMLDIECTQIEGKKWDKLKYHELLVNLKKRGQKRAEVYKDEDVWDVPIDVMFLNGRLQALLEKLGIQRLVQVYDITESDVMAVPQQGKKSWNEIVNLKKQIADSQSYYLEKYKKYYMIRELPDTTAELPLYKKIIMAVSQLAEILETRGQRRSSYIINEYFINGTSVEDIRNNLANKRDPLDKERVRQITVEIQEKMMSGSDNPLIDNAYFSDDFVNELNALSQEVLYCPVSYANQILQAPDNFDITPILRLLSLDILERTNVRKAFMDAPRIISTDDMRDFVTKHIKAVHEVMNVSAMPVTRDEILSQVMSSNTAPEKCDISMIEKIINHHLWIDIQNGQYLYRYDKLKTNNVQAARIIYEKKKLTTLDIKAIDAERRNVNPEEGIKVTAAGVMAKYPWVAKGAKNNELIYRPIRLSTIPSLCEATEEYAKLHIMFKFTDMVAYLKSKGYDQYAEGSFRAYVLKYCVPANSDKNLLCLESETQNHNPGTWRNRTVQGTTNWVINSCVKILGNKKMKKAELNKLVLAQPEADSYNVRNIYSIYLVNYCCDADNLNPNKLFILDSDSIQVNEQCLAEGLVNLDTIGTINRQPDYYMDVMTEIVNQLKQASDHRMKLVHLKQICYSLITHPSKNSVFYKITGKLPDEVEKVEIDGTIYLQLKTDKLAYEKTYSLPEKAQEVTTDADAEISEPEVVETTKPEKVYVRGKIDWSDMASELKRELDYYNRLWDVKGITLEEGIDKFVDLLENSSDDALHGDVSRHIFEFLTQKLDRYDLHDHMKSIVLGAEPIIRGIYMQNSSSTSCPRTRGLSDCLALVPELHQWVDDIFEFQSIQKYYDFRKTYLGFYGTRNKFAHGVSVEMNSGSKYQAIYSYLALYIYIYCRFAK